MPVVIDISKLVNAFSHKNKQQQTHQILCNIFSLQIGKHMYVMRIYHGLSKHFLNMYRIYLKHKRRVGYS